MVKSKIKKVKLLSGRNTYLAEVGSYTTFHNTKENAKKGIKLMKRKIYGIK